MEKDKDIIKSISKILEKPADSKYSLLIYIIYIYAFSLPVMLILSYFNPCFLNLAIPAIAVLLPYKLLKEKSLKKIVIAGVVAVLLLNLTFSVYQVEGVYYSQQPGDLSSEVLSDGTVDKVYGEQKSKFNFTVNLNKNKIQTENYTIYLNITWLTATQGEGENRPFEMAKSKNISDDKLEYYYIFNLKENEMRDRLYEHHFSIKKDTPDVEWEETDSSFGPFTISRLDAYKIIMMQQVTSTMMLFFLIVAIVWWRRRMKRSKVTSTEGLEEKEKSLDNYCPECGTLLEGKNVCPECGLDVEKWKKGGESEQEDPTPEEDLFEGTEDENNKNHDEEG